MIYVKKQEYDRRLVGTQKRLWGRFIFNCAEEEDLKGELTLNSYSPTDISVILEVVEHYRRTGEVLY